VADFLVNTLDEALRILKNEIRKCETVAVCVAAAPQAVEREMVERGVLPDLLPLHFPSDSTAPLWQRARRIEAAHVPDNQQIVTWSVASAPAQWLPKLDAIAMDCLHAFGGPESSAALRWLRLAPRYLGRQAYGFRILRCQRDAARAFAVRAQSAVECGEIGVEVRIVLNGNEKIIRHQPSS
jgi:urocanate hydratase